MRKSTRLLLAVGSVFVLIIIITIIIGPTNPEALEKKKNYDFEKLTDSVKRDSVSDLINLNNYKDTYFELSNLSKSIIEKSVKYPETLEYLYRDEWVDGKSTYVITSKSFFTDKKSPNRVYLEVHFKSENAFSQKVRNKLNLTIDFKGNKGYDFVTANIE